MRSDAVMTDQIVPVIRDYVAGLVRNEPDRMRAAMHAKACEIGYFNGDLFWQDREAMIAMIAAEADETDVNLDWQIKSIQVDGGIAVVRVRNVWAGVDFLDVLTLLKVDGQWQIVAKVFETRSPE